MTLTVGAIFTEFPTFKPEDMEKLVGHKNYNGRTQINLQNVALLKNTDLWTFAAKEEGEHFTNLLPTGQRAGIMKAAGLDAKQNVAQAKQPAQTQVSQDVMSMNGSVFDANKDKTMT